MNPFLDRIRRDWIATVRQNLVMCETRRPFTKRPKKTGTLSEAACLYLMAIVDAVRPKRVVEYGTFIGTSTLVLASGGATVYTCDNANDVVPSSTRVYAFGKTSSTTMLRRLEDVLGHNVGLWFFDGRIHEEDVRFITRYASPDAVFTFDDFEGEEKGVVNVGRLLQMYPGLETSHQLIPPPAEILDLSSKTTIAALVPRAA